MPLRTHPWRRVGPCPRGSTRDARELARSLRARREAAVATPFGLVEISKRPDDERSTLAHGDQAPCWDRGYGPGADRHQGAEIRHTRGSWAGGW